MRNPGNNQLLWNAPELGKGLAGGMRNTGGWNGTRGKETWAVDLLIASASIRCVGYRAAWHHLHWSLQEENMRWMKEARSQKAYEKEARQLLMASSSNSFNMTFFRLHSFRNDSRKNDRFIVFYSIHTSLQLLLRFLPSAFRPIR